MSQPEICRVRPVFRGGRVVPVLLCLLSVLLACPLHAAEKVRLQLRWLHQFQFAGYYMALEKGYYAQEGLDVTLLEGGPNALKPIASLMAGEVDFAISNSGVVIERMAGKPVVALAAIMQTSPIVWIVREDSGIRTPQDLAGKRLMVMPPPESAELLTAMRKEGIDLAKLNIQRTSYNIQDLIEGKTDAYDGYISNEPYFLTQHGIPYRLINPREYGVNFYNDVLLASEKTVQERPQTTEAFLRASLRGWDYALNNTEETIALIHQRYAPGKTLEHLQFEAEALTKLIMPELVQLGHMNPGRWEYIATQYVQLGMSPGPVHLDGFLYSPKKTDYTLTFMVGGVSFGLLLLTGLVAGWFARLNRQLRSEAEMRRVAEQQLRENHDRLEFLANTDRLTGIWNRLKFEEVADIEIKRSERYQYPLSLVFFDLDHFKRINDKYGHATGDHVLKRIAELVAAGLRESDAFCRWGGEEFLILLPHTNLQHAKQLAEKLRREIQTANLIATKTVTASFGVAERQSGETLKEIVHAADQALYTAKKNGRNAVEIAGSRNT